LRADGSDLLTVALIGHLDEALGIKLRSDVEKHLQAHPRTRWVLMDLSGLSDSEVLGRAELRSFQTWLSRKVERTAYLARTPRFRGLAHIAIHGAKDPNAIAVVSRQEADEWLASSGTRGALRLSKVGDA
ncbi:MAG: hypothetical protein H5U40_14060, partial [Polyangiaceae bacterium]|nr:hypothetical protein [Polyangiaceae bacterium]